MRDLYTRLSTVGFDKKWVRNCVLPDWWDDELAEVAFNRAIAEATVSAHLGFRIRDLQNRQSSLQTPEISGVCFKRNARVDLSKVAPSLQVVRRIASIVTASATELAPFVPGRTARDIRDLLVHSESGEKQPITLQRLLDFCWASGIFVVGVSNLPKKSAKFDGVAMFVEGLPVIILASGKDGPPWLVFDLAHELGHLMCGHVQEGGNAFVDAKLTDNVDDPSELEADEFALELLTGSPDGLKFRSGAIKANQIGNLAKQFASKQRPDVDPGMIVLSYCKCTSYWGVAQGGLESLGCNRGGHAIVAEQLNSHLRVDQLSESELQFLNATCHLAINVNKDGQSTTPH